MPNAIALSLHSPDFALKKEEAGGRYTVSFKNKDDDQLEVAVTLDSAVLESLIRQANALLPSSSLELSPFEINASWRESAWPLQRLSDRTWQLLLRETMSQSLILVLWYLKDRELANAVMRNMSVCAAETLTDDLVAMFEGIDPDSLPQEDSRVRGAREGLKEMLATLNRLFKEGVIAEDFS